MKNNRRCIFTLLLVIGFFSGNSLAGDGGIGLKRLTFVDETRSIQPSGEFPGSDDRRIDVIVWYPSETDAITPVEDAELATSVSRPLVIYAHGTMGYPENATHFVEYLVKQGYIVAAPAFPLTSRASFTNIAFPEMSDTPNQPGDVSFVISEILADEHFGAAIDKEKIACVGHSLGAITCYFASFGMQTRDPRIAANVLVGAGDPVQAALASDFGFDGIQHAHVSVPTLFLTGEKDIFAGLGGGPYSAYYRIEAPKYEVMIQGGTHVWFRDGLEQPDDGKNPDCLFFEKNVPGAVIPGCDQRGGLTDPRLQQAITREALSGFLNAYFKGSEESANGLRNLGERYREAKVIYQE